MIRRIVKMTFENSKIPDFLESFNKNRVAIRNFQGCQHLELWRDVKEENVFFTYSIWESEEDLNAYRHSELFQGVWKLTKSMFSEKASAWSMNKVY